MIHFEKHTLSNGLRVISNYDPSTPMAAVNLLYDVGARDEDPERTGFAHLFEHLMFEGSVNIAHFDRMLQKAGGENNAFTTNDITNYYMSLPAVNLETAFWLESDRMLGLAFSEEKLRVQKDVVVEEYRQSYLNQPYGDVWLLLRPLCYKLHPYQWSTIGKSIEHIQQASLDEVKAFFSRHYQPANAILSVAGGVDPQKVFRLAEKWFAEIPGSPPPKRILPDEPVQTQQRRLRVERQVPQSLVYLAFHSPARMEPGFYASDLLSDILSNGSSSRLIQKLIKQQKLFSEANAYIMGSIDRGLFVISGKPLPGLSVEKAEEKLREELMLLTTEGVGERELQKVKNKLHASHTFSASNVMARSMNLAYYELLGDAMLLNEQMDHYQSVSADDLQNEARRLFEKGFDSVLHYVAVNESSEAASGSILPGSDDH